MENTPEESAVTSLVRRPGSSLMPAGRGARVVSRMTAGVLDAMRRSDHLAAPERRRVGDVELDGPNYRQVLRWAKELKWTAERVVEVLLDSGDAALWGHFPEIEDGAIKTLILDGDRFGIARLEWEPGLTIETLRFENSMPIWSSGEVLSSLRELEFDDLGIEHFDLSVAPQITTLRCEGNRLAELNLLLVPNLTSLYCRCNQLTALDLSPVPNLTKLDCMANRLTHLDLSPVPNISELHCNANQLVQLDLSSVPGLTDLFCGENPLLELDLSPVPNLTELNCRDLGLTELVLSHVPKLETLDCSGLPIRRIDLSPVTQLKCLLAQSNKLTELDLSPVPKLEKLYCGHNQFAEIDTRPLDDPDIYVSADYDVRIIRAL